MKGHIRVFFVLALAPFAALAQNAALRGQVIFEGSMDAALGYRITVEHGSFRAEQTTAREGAFAFSNLPVGLCNIRVSSPDGSFTTVLHEQTLNAVKPLELRIEVERPYQVLEEVAISAEAFKTTE